MHGSAPLDEQQTSIPDLLESIISKGGEGIILRDPGAVYSPGRRSWRLSPILKVKPSLDAEAEIIAVKLKPGRKGSVTVKDLQGRVFKIGSGFRECDFFNPPAVGDVITYGFTSLHADSGIPRFPRFIRIRLDSNI